MPDGNSPSILPAKAGKRDTGRAENGFRPLLARLFGGRTRPVRAQTMMAIDLPPTESKMVESIIAFDKIRVDDVAIPRSEIVGIDINADLQELLRTFSRANHSRLPVYRGDLDDPVGMVHIKGLVRIMASPERQGDTSAPPILEEIKHEILYVPPSMPVTDLLLRMQALQIHMALVIDEYGGTDGLVTIEDLIELIVGDIKDEHDDDDEFSITTLSEGRWEVDARIPLEDFHHRNGLDLRLQDHDAETIGGLVFSLAGRVPQRGEVISHPAGFEFDISDANARRIRRVVIHKQSKRRPDKPSAVRKSADETAP